MRTNQKGKTIMLYNDTLKKMIIALAKKKNTITTKYIEIALQNQINKDKNLLTQEDLLQIIDK